MLTIERTKTLLNNPSFSDKEIEEIRDGFRALAEIIFEKWHKEKHSKIQAVQASPRSQSSGLIIKDC